MSDVLRQSAGGEAATTDREPTTEGRAPPGHQATRTRIIEVAAELFSAQGYARTPLRAISEALGVTKAALYYHFRAKDELLVAIVSPMLDRIDAVLATFGTEPVAATDRRRLLAGYLDELVSSSAIATLLIGDLAVSEHAVGRRFRDQRARMCGLLGGGDQPASMIRTTVALRALEMAAAEFGARYPGQLRATALDIAQTALGDVPPRPRPRRI